MRRDPSGLRLPSENAAFARACAEAGLLSSARLPSSSTVRRQGARPRRRPRRRGAGAAGDRRRRCSRAPRRSSGQLRRSRHRLKAIAGGGGRGMRPVSARASRRGLRARCGRSKGGVRQRRRSTPSSCWPAPATSRCRSSATARAWPPGRARMQPAAAAARRSSSSRPADLLPACASGSGCRGRLAQAASYRSLGTFEFLVDAATSVRLHRGQSAPAGRAHRHRGGHGRRPRAPAADRRRRRWPTSAAPGGAGPRGMRDPARGSTRRP